MRYLLLTLYVLAALPSHAAAQAGASRPATSAPASSSAAPATPAAPSVPPAAATSPDFVIGANDVLSVVFWREKDMSADVVVRPDGNISLPLLNDVKAAGLTPEQLRQQLENAAAKFLEEPNATVVVKEVHSRQVFITGQVNKPGAYVLVGPTTVLQLVSMAGGLLEYADKENILVVHADRRPDGEPWSDRVNYAEVLKRRNLKQNIDLKPGDTVIVP